MAETTSPNSGVSQLVTVNQQGVIALHELLEAVNSLVTAVEANTTALQAIFPQGTGTSGSATGGAATLPANPVGFINVTLPDGSQARTPYYDP